MYRLFVKSLIFSGASSFILFLFWLLLWVVCVCDFFFWLWFGLVLVFGVCWFSCLVVVVVCGSTSLCVSCCFVFVVGMEGMLR